MWVSLAQKGTLVRGETEETLASQVRALLGGGAWGAGPHSMQPCLLSAY